MPLEQAPLLLLQLMLLALLQLAQQPLPALAGPLQPWSWPRVPYFVHCSNDTGPLNGAMVDAMAAASFTVVEKWQCLYSAPNETGAEAKMIAAAAQVHEKNPQAPVFMYW